MKPNILFILLDGSRWDRLHTSPEFMELQKKGTLLNNVITSIPYTFGSMNVIFTGLYGKENGVDAYYKMFKLKDSVDFLPELLQKNGYYTSCDIIDEIVVPEHLGRHSDFRLGVRRDVAGSRCSDQGVGPCCRRAR